MRLIRLSNPIPRFRTYSLKTLRWIVLKKLPILNVVYTTMSMALVIGMYFHQIGFFIETKVQSPINFFARDYLGKSLQISPKFKILVMDDSSVAQHKISELSLKDYALIIENLGRSGVKKVFIDKVFGLIPKDQYGDLDSFNRKVKSHGGVYVGAHSAPEKIMFKKPVPEGFLKTFNSKEASWARLMPRQIYGPEEIILDSFTGIGHIDLIDTKAYPVMRPSENHVIPHLGLLAADTLTYESDGIYANGNKVPVNRFGSLSVNFVNRKKISESIYSLKSIISKSRDGEPLIYGGKSIFQDVELVIILPLYFTGNVDFKDTPVGTVAGGFYPTSIINSTLTNQWIHPTPVFIAVMMIVLTAIFGGLLGHFLPSLWIPLAATLFLLANGLSGILLFAYQNIEAPWIFVCCSALLSSLTVFVNRSHSREKTTQKLRHALSGLVPPNKLKNIINQPMSLRNEASEKFVTLMFIDIVGFSLAAEQNPPKEVFVSLRELLTNFTKTVHKHGGIVDRTLGDGLLCFFGHSYDDELDDQNHAVAAVACAIEIQNIHLDTSITKAEMGELSFPIRIGINTASVYIGDLGNNDRIDFTLIGDGVNFAKRLESSCAPFAIAMSPTTYEAGSKLEAYSALIRKKSFHVKHRTEAIAAFEIDPFCLDEDRGRWASEIIRGINKIARSCERIIVMNPENFLCKCQYGAIEIVDFSDNGFLISTDFYLSQGVYLELSVDTKDGQLMDMLQKAGISAIPCEIRWSRPLGTRHMHGVKILRMSYNQRRILINQLKAGLAIAS